MFQINVKNVAVDTFSVDAEEAAELMALTGAEENLQLTAADLMDYGDLTRAFQGCFAVFLTTPSADSLNGLKEYPVSIVSPTR